MDSSVVATARQLPKFSDLIVSTIPAEEAYQKAEASGNSTAFSYAERRSPDSRGGIILLLVAIGVVEPTPTDDVFQLAPAHLAIGIAFLELGLPVEAALTTRKIFTEHGRAIAEEMTEVFRTQIWPHLRESDLPPEDMTAMIERFKPLTVQALVTAYEEAVDESKRATVRKRT